MFTGILPIARTEDGLAAILGHEIAHNVARHSAEAMSQNLVFIAPLRFLLIALDYSGYTMGFARVLGDMMMGLGVVRPASRKQESEADYIGLMIMAKACYNPEAAVGVWDRMEKAEKSKIPEWLSTHPSVRCPRSKNHVDSLIHVECESDRENDFLATQSPRG